MASFLYCFLYSYRSFNYCDSKSCRSFMLLKAIAKSKSTHIAIAFKSDNYCCRNSWKSDICMESNTEKMPWTNLQNVYKNWSKGIKSDIFAIAKLEEQKHIIPGGILLWKHSWPKIILFNLKCKIIFGAFKLITFTII